jgi:hypothetical protein
LGAAVSVGRGGIKLAGRGRLGGAVSNWRGGVGWARRGRLGGAVSNWRGGVGWAGRGRQRGSLTPSIVGASCTPKGRRQTYMRARGRGRVQMVPRAAAAACAECEVAWLMASRAWRSWARVAVPRRKVRCCGPRYFMIRTGAAAEITLQFCSFRIRFLS